MFLLGFPPSQTTKTTCLDYVCTRNRVPHSDKDASAVLTHIYELGLINLSSYISYFTSCRWWNSICKSYRYSPHSRQSLQHLIYSCYRLIPGFSSTYSKLFIYHLFSCSSEMQPWTVFSDTEWWISFIEKRVDDALHNLRKTDSAAEMMFRRRTREHISFVHSPTHFCFLYLTL